MEDEYLGDKKILVNYSISFVPTEATDSPPVAILDVYYLAPELVWFPRILP